MAAKKGATKKGVNPFAKKGSKPFAKKGEQKTIKCPKCGATITT